MVGGMVSGDGADAPTRPHLIADQRRGDRLRHLRAEIEKRMTKTAELLTMFRFVLMRV
jgi:hypothetical protein